MAAAMNGMALHGGLIPYGGTFLVFSDYCRPAIRLSALMRQRVIYVMTHDSIGLGEDGPTHQPVEQLASLRAIPNLNVFRPADGVETAECWELAVRAGDTPSILALTRQAVPNLRTAETDGEPLRQGRLRAGRDGRARRATSPSWRPARRWAWPWRRASLLAKDGIEAAVVSMPCWELFASQPVAYRNEVLGTAPARGRGGGRGAGLGALAGRERRLHRHDRLRRLGPRRQALRALRHHAGQDCGGGAQADSLRMSS